MSGATSATGREGPGWRGGGFRVRGGSRVRAGSLQDDGPLQVEICDHERTSPVTRGSIIRQDTD